MAQKPATAPEVLRPTDDQARILARDLVRASFSASLASIGADGAPLATLVSVAPDSDGQPVMLVSRLSSHTTNLLATPACSLLFMRGGKGDPLAHPRVSVSARARVVERDSAEGLRARARFLARQPKAALYVDFPDFLFIKADVDGASLNGGFGRAFALERTDVVTVVEDASDLMLAEDEILTHMNGDHASAVAACALHLAGRAPGPWRMTSIDPDGFEVASGTEIARITFDARIVTAHEAHMTLVALAKKARAIGQGD